MNINFLVNTNNSEIVQDPAYVYTVGSIGKANPIRLPITPFGIIRDTIGKKIGHGDCATIFEVKNSTPPRVYKVISDDTFTNGDEIRISKVAGAIGVAPAFHQAFLMPGNEKRHVFIEMDYAGKSLGKLMEDFAQDNTPVNSSETLGDEERAFRERLKKMQEELNKQSSFVVIEAKRKERVSLEEAINKIYGNEESFYNELFSRIKELAEKNIAYCDTHVGNIIPGYNTGKSLQLIDFDGAKRLTNPKEAVKAAMLSPYNFTLFNQFATLPNLSQSSKELIQWFQNAFA